ncbi:hypothetical protein BH11PAT4_BH11PAT4_8080 [soil metagenome]
MIRTLAEITQDIQTDAEVLEKIFHFCEDPITVDEEKIRRITHFLELPSTITCKIVRDGEGRGFELYTVEETQVTTPTGSTDSKASRTFRMVWS